MKITRPIVKDELTNKWYQIDAKGVRLGKLATKIASLLQGKQKVTMARHMDSGDSVIVINCELIDVHQSKLSKKKYYRHSGYMGGLKTESLSEKLQTKPAEILKIAVEGMLPHNKMGSLLIKKLYVYKGVEHPHVAQKPEIVEIK